MANQTETLISTVRKNCNISDAKDNGIYSMCMLFMRLRNLFKWENGLAPWEEAEPPVLLDWIAQKEDEWESLSHSEFSQIPYNGRLIEPTDTAQINKILSPKNLCYGAGSGKSLKAVFFLAHVIEEKMECGCQITVLGKEEAKELDSPFALLQGDSIFFRTDPYRYFLWDRVTDTDAANKTALRHALGFYKLLDNCGKINLAKFKEKFDYLINQEMTPIIRHEIGEMIDKTMPSKTLNIFVHNFPGTIIELLTRSVKDVLADLNDEGMLGWIIHNQRQSSLGFYVTFIDGFRKLLAPEIKNAAAKFWETGDWRIIETARQSARQKNRIRAEQLIEISNLVGIEKDSEILSRVKREILEPLGV